MINNNFKRQKREVKKKFILKCNSPTFAFLVPVYHKPKLAYHGIDIEQMVTVDIDIYKRTGKIKPDGQVYKYSHTKYGALHEHQETGNPQDKDKRH